MFQSHKNINALTGKPDGARGGGALAGLRVLIAERHFSVRTWMREQMSVIGATSISMAANASELMRMARTLPYDIVICDHHLDEKRDGQQLLEELRFQHILPLRSVFIIATAERKYNHVVAAAEFAPDDYLVKPYTPEQLSVRLDRSLRKKKALRQVFDHLEKADHEAAIAACDDVVKQTPRYLLDALRIKAESLVTLGRVEEAAAIYESIVSTRAVPWARMGYAMTLQRQKRLDEALGEAQRLNDEHPEFISVYDMLAQMHEEAGEYDKAIECLERASAITSSSTTERLRKIADIAEAAGDRPKVISTMKRVVERTRKSSMLKVDDYLALTRSLIDEERLDEAAKVAEELRAEAKNAKAGAIGTEVAAAMVHRGKGQMVEAKNCLERVLGLFDSAPAEATDAMAMEIAEEAAQHGDVGRAAAIIAKVSVKSALPSRIKSRLHAWFGSETEPEETGEAAAKISRKAVLAEQIVLSMLDSIAALEDDWSDETAANAREKLIDAFTLMPRDKRVINAHIRYNSIAVKHGGLRHAPTTRTNPQ
ncbi:response regulator [Propionivibrio sp.]|uniref:response regulator n=1 Tax=Propionivibrio sp. TaxID=2212460 RepID=UPI0039E54270